MRADLRRLEQELLANGKIEGSELEVLRQHLGADRRISRDEAEFLIELHKRVQRVTPAFEKYFYQAIKRHVLDDGVIKPGEVTWLRTAVLGNGRTGDLSRKMLHELRGEAREVSPE